ncbi:MAG: hypothetical protein ACOX9R_14550 [Armatimonadota bacterium]
MVHRSTTAVMIALLIAASACAQEQFPANSDFTAGLAGWTAPEGSGLEGGALALAGGNAVSDASAEPLEGWQRVEARVKGPGRASDSALTLALVAAGDERPLAQAAVGASEAGTSWRTLSAELLPPPGALASVVVGVRGDARWLIDSVSVRPVDPPGAEPSGNAPVLPEPLPGDWEPEGLLNAIRRPLGVGSELLVQVGGLEVGMPEEVTAQRGHRGAVPLIVTSRAMGERPLTVSVTGPPGFFAPERTVTIRPGRNTVFRASVQAFFVGTRTARITFRSGQHEASAPIRVTVEPSYPAPGVAITGGEPPAGMLDGLAQLGIPLVAAAQAVALPESLTRLALLPPPWSDEALRSAAGQAAGRAEFIALHHPRGEAADADALAATSELRAALNATAGAVATLGPPADLQAGSPPEITEADLTGARRLGATGAISAPTLRLPVLEARPARAVMLDRAPVASPQPAWTALSEALEMEAIARAIREGARLPIFFADLAARSTGSAETDAAVLARVLAVCAYQGATGWTVPARTGDAPGGADAFCPFTDDGALRGPVAQAYSELSRELAAAAPVMILSQTPEIGRSPGAAVGFRPFIRNDEGILALWNNTGAPVDLLFEMHTPPLDLHTVTVGPGGVTREYVGEFRFSEDAVTLNRPVVFVTLQPGQVKVLSMQLARAQTGWLSSVEYRPRIRRSDGGGRSFIEEWKERGLYR